MPMKSDKKVIASIVRHKDIEKVIKYKENIKSVFILISDFINIKDIVQLFHDNDLEVYIHVEMIKGLKLDEFGFKYLKNVVKPDGIITTKSSHVNLAKKNNIYVIQRFF
ncbi:hypothetical protein ER639_10405 [Macrococcus sp. DPC7161]|nr:glycerol-3-phosphate responsive antiterminator [Macrococcus sp. DPC7161]RXK17387.1 hypothetical protein ER639_10405 [Macrococcus sp. DPC7161]